MSNCKCKCNCKRICTNITKNSKLWSILVGFVLLAGLIIGIFFGMNNAPVMNDAKTITVSTDSYVYTKYEKDLKKECENIFADKKVKYTYTMESETTGNVYEIVYVFDKETELSEVTRAVKEMVATKTAEDGAWSDCFIDVMSATEEVKAVTTEGYALRGVIACVVMTVLAIVYVCLRYRWDMGVLTGGAMLLTFLLSTALIALLRIPVTNSVAYVIVLSGLLSAVIMLFTLNNIRDNKPEANEEAIADNIAVKEIGMIAIVVFVALVALMIAGLIANTALVWFAAASLVGLISAIVVGGVYAPSMYLPLKKLADKKASEKDKRYVGAKAKEKETEKAEE